MMMATALIFPIALVMALCTIGAMLRTYSSKMMAALRMEHYVPEAATPLPSLRTAPRAASRRANLAPAPLTLAAQAVAVRAAIRTLR